MVCWRCWPACWVRNILDWGPVDDRSCWLVLRYHGHTFLWTRRLEWMMLWGTCTRSRRLDRTILHISKLLRVGRDGDSTLRWNTHARGILRRSTSRP